MKKLDKSTTELLDLCVYRYVKGKMDLQEINYCINKIADAYDCHPNKLMAAYADHTQHANQTLIN